jgi:hypothetical protein
MMKTYDVHLNRAGEVIDIWPLIDWTTAPERWNVYRITTRHGDEAEAIYKAQRLHAKRSQPCIPQMF